MRRFQAATSIAIVAVKAAAAAGAAPHLASHWNLAIGIYWTMTCNQNWSKLHSLPQLLLSASQSTEAVTEDWSPMLQENTLSPKLLTFKCAHLNTEKPRIYLLLQSITFKSESIDSLKDPRKPHQTRPCDIMSRLPARPRRLGPSRSFMWYGHPSHYGNSMELLCII